MKIATKKWLISFGLFLMITCSLGLPFRKMNFFWDSYGDFLHTMQAKQRGSFFKTIFIDDVTVEENCAADNQAHGVDRSKPLTLFGFMYRPLIYFYRLIQINLFGVNPYIFFLLHILLHACNVVMLFLLLATLLPLAPSTLLACFFAYNHSWWSLLRWIAVQFYFIEALCILFFIWCLYKTLTTNRFIWGVPAAFCLFHNLLLKEQSLALVPWLGMVFLAEHMLVYKHAFIDWDWIKRCFLFSWPSLIALGAWVLTRWLILQNALQAWPINTSTSTVDIASASGVGSAMLRWLINLPNILVDLVGLDWFPPFHKLEKMLTLVLLVSFFIWLLSFVKPPAWLLFFTISYLLFAWPTYTLRHYHPRYVYMAMPLFIGLIALALKILHETNWRQYRFAFAGLTLISMLNAGFLVKRMCVSERETDLVAQSFKTLVAENPTIFERTMCFYGLPPELFDACVAQAMTWLAPHFQRRTIYYFKYEKTIAACKLDAAFLATDPLFITWDSARQKMVIVAQEAA